MRNSPEGREAPQRDDFIAKPALRLGLGPSVVG